MSRLNSLSTAAIKAMYSSETEESLIMLLTISDPDPALTPLRLADGFTGRLEALTTDQDIIYGVTSRTLDYVFIPMQITLPSEQDTGMGQCSLVIKYAAPEAIELVRTRLTKPTKVLLELVLSGSPNTVEVSFSDFYITSVTYNADQISFDLNMISFNREPFPCFNFTPGYFPGLF